MAEHRIDVEATVEPWRRTDGLLFGVRVTMVIAGTTKVLGGGWWWLNRETDQLEELKPYRVGMRLGRKR